MENHVAQSLCIRNLEPRKTDHQSLTFFIKKSSHLAWSLTNTLTTFASRSKGAGFFLKWG